MSFFKGEIEFEKKLFLLSFSKKLCADVVKNTANILSASFSQIVLLCKAEFIYIAV